MNDAGNWKIQICDIFKILEISVGISFGISFGTCLIYFETLWVKKTIFVNFIIEKLKSKLPLKNIQTE